MEAMKDGSHYTKSSISMSTPRGPVSGLPNSRFPRPRRFPGTIRAMFKILVMCLAEIFEFSCASPKKRYGLVPVTRTRSSLADRTLSPVAATVPLRSWCCRESANTTSSRSSSGATADQLIIRYGPTPRRPPARPHR